MLKMKVYMLSAFVMLTLAIGAFVCSDVYANPNPNTINPATCPSCGGRSGDQDCYDVNIGGSEGCLVMAGGNCYAVGHRC